MTIQTEDLLFQVALSRTNGIGPAKYRALIEHFGSAANVFNASIKALSQVQGISINIAKSLKETSDFKAYETELELCNSHNIRIISMSNEEYPSLLKNCIDAPPILFLKGTHSFGTLRHIAIVGTRNNSDYGKKMCEQLVSELKGYDVCIVSGLAYGIDAIAHKAALLNDIPTVAVLAHGLSEIYPPSHKNLATEIQQRGALCTEYNFAQKPEMGHFPTRNRIVAGLCEATIVIETNIKGGSMITAELAHGYNRDVFAVPGRTTDSRSSGCNHLIKTLKAQMLCSADDLASSLGWKQSSKKKSTQRQLFIELSNEEQRIYDFLTNKENAHIDEIMSQTELSSSQMASALLSLEMQQIIRISPGKLISLFN